MSDTIGSYLTKLRIKSDRSVSASRLALDRGVSCALSKGRGPLPLLQRSLVPKARVYFPLSVSARLYPCSVSSLLRTTRMFRRIYGRCFCDQFRHAIATKRTMFLKKNYKFLSGAILCTLFNRSTMVIMSRIFGGALKHRCDIRGRRGSVK